MYELNYSCCEDTLVFHNEEETRFLAQADSDDAFYSVTVTMPAPIEDTYIMLPACAYDGNRFEAVQRKYPPMFLESEFGVKPPVRMTQVPRLAPEGDSKMEVTTGDLSVPCVCVFHKKAQKAFALFTEQGAHSLNHGITLEQKGDTLIITLRAPAKRALVYRWYEGYPSLRENPTVDEKLQVKKGMETVVLHKIFEEPCESITEMYRLFFAKRADLYHGKAQNELPYSAFFEMVQEQMNLDQFEEKEEFYTLSALDGRDNSKFGKWQAGWVGGGMNTYPLLCEGNALSVERAIKTLLFAGRYQSKAGFFYGIVCNGKIYHDCFGYYEDKYNLLLIRKHADLVYYMAKQVLAMREKHIDFPQSILESLKKGADAMVTMWKKYHQLGQFVNAETGEIVIGGSASGAMASAALITAYYVLEDREYMAYAYIIAESYYEEFTEKGITNGGPGEILSAPDSESAAAMVESLMCMYEFMGEERLLKQAEDAACQLASWVVPYDYEFPKNSRFGKMGILSTGSVWANVQNKHSAPGLCTISPSMYWRLFRATKNQDYLKIMREIAHYMPQSASYPQHPMMTIQGYALKNGEMCERVNLSDWEGKENVGDSIFGASSWPTTSLFVTTIDVPGVYAVPEMGIVSVQDHINAMLSDGKLVMENPTDMAATVTYFVEPEEDLDIRYCGYYHDMFKKVTLQPKEKKVIDI